MRHLCPKNQPQRLRIRGGNPSRRHRNREEMYGVCKVVHPLSSRRLLAIALAVQVNRGHNQESLLLLLLPMSHGDSPLHLSNQRGGSSLPGNKYPLHQQLLTMPTPRRPGNKAPVRDRLLVAHRPPATLGTVRIEEGKEPGRVYEVRKEELSIGRSRESDIFLEDLAVSRLHAKILSLG